MQEVFKFAKSNFPLLLPTLGYAAVWVILRFIFYTALRRYWRSSPGKHMKDIGLQEKVLEESFAILGAAVAVVVGLQAFFHTDQGGCGLRSTASCFVGWPSATGPRHPSITLYHTVELGWYLHYLIKHPLGIGMEDNLQMHLHHASTISLLLMSFLCNLHRGGVLVLTLVSVSNPFLHVAKVVHYVESPWDKITFGLFALSFFLSRIVGFPLLVLKATLYDSLVAQPAFRGPYLPVYLAANGLLLGLQVMQVQWFAGIIRLLKKAMKSDEAFKAEGKAFDYAKIKAEAHANGGAHAKDE